MLKYVGKGLVLTHCDRRDPSGRLPTWRAVEQNTSRRLHAQRLEPWILWILSQECKICKSPYVSVKRGGKIYRNRTTFQ